MVFAGFPIDLQNTVRSVQLLKLMLNGNKEKRHLGYLAPGNIVYLPRASGVHTLGSRGTVAIGSASTPI